MIIHFPTTRGINCKTVFVADWFYTPVIRKVIRPADQNRHKICRGQQACEQNHSCNPDYFFILHNLQNRECKVGNRPQYLKSNNLNPTVYVQINVDQLSKTYYRMRAFRSIVRRNTPGSTSHFNIPECEWSAVITCSWCTYTLLTSLPSSTKLLCCVVTHVYDIYTHLRWSNV